MSSEKDIESTFAMPEIPNIKRKKEHFEGTEFSKNKKFKKNENVNKKKSKDNVNYKQDEYFLPYRSKDAHTEKGLEFFLYLLD